MAGLLYPAYQKFYSALRNIEEFDKENNFFDNISNLDNFFSEYRNITFVMQKSLAHTEYMSLYDKYRTQFLNDHWFIDKRNEVIKEQPFRLIKQIDISIYFPSYGFTCDTKKFTVENDISINKLIDSIKEKFLETNLTEVFFSAKYIFYEEGKTENIIQKCIDGIKTMEDFMTTMYNEVGEKCSLCEELKNKITNYNFINTPMDFILIDDYVFYPNKNQFNRAQRISAFPGFSNYNIRAPLSNFGMLIKNFDDDYFKKFVAMNIIMQSTDVMSTTVSVYDDDTFSIEMYTGDFKTTFYRKINETAEKIAIDHIKELYFMMVYVVVFPLAIQGYSTSAERMKHADHEILVFAKINKDIEQEEYAFEGDKIKDNAYLIYQLTEGKKKQLYYSKENMVPIIEAFKKKSDI